MSAGIRGRLVDVTGAPVAGSAVTATDADGDTPTFSISGGADASKFGMGKRSQRWSAIVEDGVVKELNVEEPGAFSVSSADYMLGQL